MRAFLILFVVACAPVASTSSVEGSSALAVEGSLVRQGGGMWEGWEIVQFPEDWGCNPEQSLAAEGEEVEGGLAFRIDSVDAIDACSPSLNPGDLLDYEANSNSGTEGWVVFADGNVAPASYDGTRLSWRRMANVRALPVPETR